MNRLPETIVIATRNKGKAAEFKALLAPLGIQVRSLLELETSVPEVEEDGATFEENAAKKARSAAEALGFPVIADDSGLCVDALGGEPGVRSARYAGEDATDDDNNRKLLSELSALGTGMELDAGVRAFSPARFVCVLAMYDVSANNVMYAKGSVEGVVINEARGTNGFGYDPLFFLPELGKTFAELAPAHKNELSHRAQALRSFIKAIQYHYGGNGG